MAKKKSGGGLLGLILGLAAIGVAVLAICMMFAPGIMVKIGSVEEELCTGFQAIFGQKEEVLGMEVTVSKFNTVGFIAFICVIVGGVFGFLGKGNLSLFLATVAFVVAGIIFFLFLRIYPIGLEGDAAKDLFKEAVKNEMYVLGSGPIVAGIASLGGAVATLLKKFLCNN